MAAPKKRRPRRSAEPPDPTPAAPVPTPSDAADPQPSAADVFAALGRPLEAEPETEAETASAGGRPPIKIDLQVLSEGLGWNCTDEELAAHLGCSVRTLERRRANDPVVRAMFEQQHAKGRRSLKRVLWGLALRANDGEPPRGAVSALIFLAKQPLHRGGLGMSGSAGLGDDAGIFDLDSAREELLERLEQLAPSAAAKVPA